MGAFRIPLVIAVVIAVFTYQPEARGASPIAPFIGSYEGQSLFPSGEVKGRELTTVIRPFGDDGFSVRWKTLIFKPKEEPHKRTQVLYFRPLPDRPNIFVATSGDQAEGVATGSPWDGSGMAWARIRDKTLTVNVLTVTDDGDTVIQSYDRVLTPNGELALAFTRIRNGETEQQIRGEMERIGE